MRRNNWLAVLIGVGLAVAGFFLFRSCERGRQAIDSVTGEPAPVQTNPQPPSDSVPNAPAPNNTITGGSRPRRGSGSRRRARALAACAGLFFLPGCLPATKEKGLRIGDITLEQFQAGVTTEEWLIAVLGPPTSMSIVEGVENTKVFRYQSSVGSTGFMSAFSGAGGRITSVTYFIITNGIVTRYWADRAREYTTMFGKPIEVETGPPDGEAETKETEERSTTDR